MGLAAVAPVLSCGTGSRVDDNDGFAITDVAFDGESPITLTVSQSSGSLSVATTYRFAAADPMLVIESRCERAT